MASTILNELMGWALDNLPEDWRIEVWIDQGECGIGLSHDGSLEDFCRDDLTPEGEIVHAVDHARECENLPMVPPPAIDGLILSHW